LSTVGEKEIQMRLSRCGVLAAVTVLGGLVAAPAPFARVLPADDAATVAALDTEYQAAVKRNDAATMDRILADDFVLVTGRGQTYTKADLMRAARNKLSVYEHQEELEQKVRVWGDTAVVTALLWIKGTSGDKPFERKLWFSDTYVRTAEGWRYVLGQASLPLP
jgi:ketosteroid isomerase-like protein